MLRALHCGFQGGLRAGDWRWLRHCGFAVRNEARWRFWFCFVGVGRYGGACCGAGLRVFAARGGLLVTFAGHALALFGHLVTGFRSLLAGFAVAGGLGAVEIRNGALVTALPVGSVAEEIVEGLPFRLGFVFQRGHYGHVVERGDVLDGGMGKWVHRMPVEDGVFGDIEAAEGPLAVGDFLDGGFLALGPRAVDAEEVGVEGQELGWVFIVEDHVALDGEAEFEGVLGGPGFALGRDGSGGMRGVGAVPDSDRW